MEEVQGKMFDRGEARGKSDAIIWGAMELRRCKNIK
jgi:hypothetical protein